MSIRSRRLYLVDIVVTIPSRRLIAAEAACSLVLQRSKRSRRVKLMAGNYGNTIRDNQRVKHDRE